MPAELNPLARSGVENIDHHDLIAPNGISLGELPVAVRVLLIDDNLPDRVRYRRMLQRESQSFEIVEAEDGHRGLALLAAKGQPFDCVLLDQDLPDLQGLDVLEDIGAHADAPPVIMLTGEEDAAVSIEALRRGAADYLMKRRIDEDRLLRAVRGAIERATLARRVALQQQRLSRFYRLANQTEDALFIVEADTLRISDGNEAARRRLGVQLDGAAQSAPTAFGSLETWQAFCREAAEHGSARYEWHQPGHTDAAGVETVAETVIEISAQCVQEEGLAYIVAIGRDITLRKQRERALLERALRDGLTGIWNRRAFDDRLVDVWHSSERSGRPLAVLLMDVDHFKFYNDGLGHPAGDDCLRRVAQALENGVLRSNSMLARYGGEEFVALIEDADTEAAMAIAERLRAVVEQLALPHPRSDVGPHVTVSIGVASGVAATLGFPKSLIDAADAALYSAKRNGRNRAVRANGLVLGA